ncbi:MAG: Prolyl-tRNA synthetase, class IIa, prokaryotic-type [Candidatus Syntrophoarchaeum caldarius]|uniref:Proline--tRNA ligase n=1 Tax=Candidatus Syntropharchaeum caldarium TaxID=1838285 RepID=A0A1F2PBS3_9EURY|nr:MAG: Prolyl-tRNA synthetase, class IIa, prokaryotic-type [Candidatus Syntrophoarchaeum caldarius]
MSGKEENFSEWYNEILQSAEIMDVRYPVKGLYVWYPFGFSLRRQVYDFLRSLLDRDHKETLFPMLVPEQEFMKEAEHIKGFENEVYWVTKGGMNELDVPLVLRPTSETAIYPIFKLWIRSHADLPIRIYQIVNTFRHETKHTRPLIRLREITSFKEAHTAHATWEDAEKQVKDAVSLYKEFFTMLAIPFLITRRPDWDKFPGAEYTIAFDTLMPDGRTLQIGTIHNLGENFAHTFDIRYEDPEGKQQFINQTCYGISERCIAALISVHGDDKGLVLPPAVAPHQVVIVPIVFSDKRKEEVLDAACTLRRLLEDEGIRVVLDDRDERPGAKYYHWEHRGVPLRVEIGPKDLDEGVYTLARRDGRPKSKIESDKILDGIKEAFEEITESIQQAAEKSFRSRITGCSTLEEVETALKRGVARIYWCGNPECGHEIEDQLDLSILGLSEEEKEDRGPCIICSKSDARVSYLARTF